MSTSGSKSKKSPGAKAPKSPAAPVPAAAAAAAPSSTQVKQPSAPASPAPSSSQSPQRKTPKIRKYAIGDHVQVNYNPDTKDIWVHGVVKAVLQAENSYDVQYDDGFVEQAVSASFLRPESVAIPSGESKSSSAANDAQSLENRGASVAISSDLLPPPASTSHKDCTQCASLQRTIELLQTKIDTTATSSSSSSSSSASRGTKKNAPSSSSNDQEALDLDLETLSAEKLLEVCLQFKYLYIESDEASKQLTLDKEMLVENAKRHSSETERLTADLQQKETRLAEAQTKTKTSSDLADKLKKEVAELKKSSSRAGRNASSSDKDKDKAPAGPAVDEEAEKEREARESEIASLKETISELTQRITIGSTDRKNLESENVTLTAKTQTQETELQRLNDESYEMSKKIETLEALQSQLQASLTSVTEAKDAAVKQKKTEGRELMTIQKQLEDAKDALSLSKHAQEELSTANAAFKQQVAELLALHSPEAKHRTRLLAYFEVGQRCEMLTSDKKSPTQIWSGGKLSKFNDDDNTFNVYLDEGVSKMRVHVEQIRVLMAHGKFLLNDRVEVDSRGLQLAGKVSRINPENTYVVYFDNGSVEVKVPADALKLISPPTDVYKTDDPVIVLDISSSIWYSGLVTSISESTVSVQYDYGESDPSVDVSRVRAWVPPTSVTNCQVCQGLARITRQSDDCRRYARELQLAHEMAADGASLSALEMSKLRVLIKNAWVYATQEARILTEAVSDLAKFFQTDDLSGHSSVPAGMEEKSNIAKVIPTMEPISRERFDRLKREKLEEERRRRLVVEEERRKAEAERRLAEETFAGDAIKKAAQKGDLATLTPLVERWSGDPVLSTPSGTTSTTPVFVASERGNSAALELLLTNGASHSTPDTYGNSPLSEAAGNGHEKVIGILIKAGAEVNSTNKDGCTPVYRAVGNGHKDVVNQLIKSGADVNKANKSGRSPALMACWAGQAECLEVLINNKADVNACDVDKWSCLLSACANNHIACLDLLLKNRQLGDINGANNYGQSSLYMAAKNGHLDVLNRLLDRGANVNASDTDGDTAVFIAAQEGRLGIMEALIKAGADITIANKNGLTPAKVAAQAFQAEAVEYLKAVEAREMERLKHEASTAKRELLELKSKLETTAGAAGKK